MFKWPNKVEMVDEKVPKMGKATAESKEAEFASSNGKCASPFQLPTINSIRPSEAMHVNVVKVLEDSDYKYARKLCDEHADWALVFERKSTRVWTRQFAGSPFAMIKARSEFKDVGADTCYDVLQDAEYRYKWDKHVLDTVQVGYLNPNNDICYFAIGALPPIRSRDFVLLRSWLDLGSEKFILAHSVWHDRFPPTKSHVRGVVYLTVYFVRSLTGGGCQVTYLTLADPRGKLPSWLINRLTKTIAPRLAKKLHKSCLNYKNWQRKHGKEGRQKSWLMEPEQILLECPKLDLAQCIPKGGQQFGQEDEVDETFVKPVDEPPEEEE